MKLLHIFLLLFLLANFAVASSRLVWNDPALCPGQAEFEGPQYGTIQAAVDASTSGDIIFVCPGTYTENVLVSKPLSILGFVVDRTTVIARSPSQPVFSITASDVLIQRLTISGAHGDGLPTRTPSQLFAGIYSTSASRLNVVSNRIVDNIYGVSCNSCNTLRVDSNFIYAASQGQGFGIVASGSDITLSGNTIEHFDVGVKLDAHGTNFIVSSNVAGDVLCTDLSSQCAGFVFSNVVHSQFNENHAQNIMGTSSWGFLISGEANNNAFHSNIATNIQGIGFGFRPERNSFGNVFMENSAERNSIGFWLFYPHYFASASFVQNSAMHNREGFFLASFASLDEVGESSTIILDRNVADSNEAAGFHLQLGCCAQFINNVARHSMGLDGKGFYFQRFADGLLDGNVAEYTSRGFVFSEARNILVQNNVARNNVYEGFGLYFVQDAALANNLVDGLLTDGVDYSGTFVPSRAFRFKQSSAILRGENRITSTTSGSWDISADRVYFDRAESVGTDGGAAAASRNRLVTDYLTVFFQATSDFWLKTTTATAADVDPMRCAPAVAASCRLLSFGNVARVAVDPTGSLNLGIFYDKLAAAGFEKVQLAYYQDGWIPFSGSGALIDRDQGFAYYGPLHEGTYIIGVVGFN